MRDDRDDIRETSDGSTTMSVVPKLSDAQAKVAAATFRRGTTAGAGLGKIAKSSAGMPKQEAGEDAGAYGARLRKWREGASPEVAGQKKALLSMKP